MEFIRLDDTLLKGIFRDLPKRACSSIRNILLALCFPLLCLAIGGLIVIELHHRSCEQYKEILLQDPLHGMTFKEIDETLNGLIDGFFKPQTWDEICKVVDKDGNTLLHKVVERGSCHFSKKLAERCPEALYVRNNEGKLPIDLANANGAICLRVEIGLKTDLFSR